MTWFKVDDDLAFHRKVVAAGNAAMGLWVRAGAWSAQQLTDGFIPEHVLTLMGTAPQVKKLIKVGLWGRVDGGVQFHQWNENGRQPTSESVRVRRAKDAERKRERRDQTSGQFRALDRAFEPPLQVDDTCPDGTPSGVRDGVRSGVRDGVRPTPTRPDPTRPLEGGYLGGEGAARERGGTPRPRCPRHAQLPPDADVPPCGQCAERRRAAEQGTADNLLGQLAERTARRAAIDACGRCDDNGMRETETGVARCTHGARLEAVS